MNTIKLQNQVHLHQDFKDSPALQTDNSHQEKYERNKTLFRETISELAFHSDILRSEPLEKKINTASILSRIDVIGMLSEYRKELYSDIKNGINLITPTNNIRNNNLSSTLTDIVLLSEELKNINNNMALNNDVVHICDFSPALLLNERRLALEKQLKDKKSELLKAEAILIQDLTSKKNELQLVSQHLRSSTDNQKTIAEQIKCSTLTSEIEETKKLRRHCLTVLYLTNQNRPLTGKTPPTLFPETYSLIATAYDGIHNKIEAYGELSRILTLDKINHSEVIAINKIAKKIDLDKLRSHLLSIIDQTLIMELQHLEEKNKLSRDDFECRKKDLKEKITKEITDNKSIKEQLADTILKNPAFQKLNNQLHEMKNEITKLDNIDNYIAKLTLEAELQKDEVNKLKTEASQNLTLVGCIKKLDELKINLSNLNYDDVLNRINDLQLAISSEHLLINPTSIEIYNKHIKNNIINFVTTTKSSAKNREEWISLAREATNSAFRHEIKKELIESESQREKIEKIVSEIKRGTIYINSLNQTLLQSTEIQQSEKKLKTIESELLSLTSTASQRQKNRLYIESESISTEQKIKKLEYEINTGIILKAKDIIDKNMEKELDEIIKKSNEYKKELQNKASFLTQEVEEKVIPFFHSTFSESFKHSCDFLHEIYSDDCELTYERQGNNGTCVLSAINSALNNRNKMPLTPFRLEVFSRDLAIIEINKFLTEAERKNMTINSLQERINHLFSLSANPLCYKENKKMMIYMNSGVRDEQYVKSNMISPSHLLDLYNHLDPQVANNIDINLNQSAKLTPYGREKIKSIMDKNNTIIVGFQGDNMKCGHAISFIKQTDSKWFLKDSNIAPVLLDPLAFINPLLQKPLNLIKTGTDYLKKYSSSAFKYISVRFSL